MKKADAVVRLLLPDIKNKDILEVACGTADFSVSASGYAKSVSCIDLDDSRLSPQSKQSNIHFQIMDASNMDYPDHVFDTAVVYNAFYHIQNQWAKIERECRRVLKPKGILYMVGTWKLDTGLMLETFGKKAIWQNGYLIIKMIMD